MLEVQKKILPLLIIFLLVDVLSIHRGPAGISKRMEELKGEWWGQRRYQLGFVMEAEIEKTRWRHKMKRLLETENSVLVTCPVVLGAIIDMFWSLVQLVVLGAIVEMFWSLVQLVVLGAIIEMFWSLVQLVVLGAIV